MPLLLENIHCASPGAVIKILVATGFHRLTLFDELLAKFGEYICRNEYIEVHDSRNMENMVFKGILPSGGELWVNSLVDWADFIAAEGFIEPHFFAGFSGGRKSNFPA